MKTMTFLKVVPILIFIALSSASCEKTGESEKPGSDPVIYIVGNKQKNDYKNYATLWKIEGKTVTSTQLSQTSSSALCVAYYKGDIIQGEVSAPNRCQELPFGKTMRRFHCSKKTAPV